MENFVVSALKYRPQNFDSVVGQSHITTTLKNAIRNNQLAHAFLFCGPRGVGKTTCARILAKTINCENLQPDGEACNRCASCKSFNDGASFNIHELDAASNNSVDDIRTLTEQVRFAPQAGRYKIYIIDEVHMLSSSAFNAFLKTLEEPPSYALFILATTEKHKILPTILSRCQIFDFKRITIHDTVNHLKEICKKEKITADPDALHLIAQKTEGCMRDALSTMDKIVSFTNGHLTYQNTLEHLNILDYDYFFRVMDALLEQDLAAALLIFDEILQKGFEGDNFLNGFAEFIRNLLVCQDERSLPLMEVSGNLKDRYKKASSAASAPFLLSALNILNDAEISYKQAYNKRLHVEVTLVRLGYLQQAVELVSDNRTGEVSKKKLVNDAAPRQLRAPFARPLAFPSPVRPPSEARLTIVPEKKREALPADDRGQAPAITEHQGKPTPAITGHPGKPAPSGTNDRSEKTASITATGPQNIDRLPEAGSSPVPATGNIPIGGNLRQLKDNFARRQSPETDQQNIPLTEPLLQEKWQFFIAGIRESQQSPVAAGLEMAIVSIAGDREVKITCGNELQKHFIEEEKTAIAGFLKKEFRDPTLLLTIIVEERPEAKDAPKTLTAREQYARLIEKYPLVKELKDKLNMELDY